VRRAPLLLLLLAGCDGTAKGREAYRDGRYEEALLAFDGSSPEVFYDRALAALRVGQWDVALEAASEAAARGGPEFAARRDFVRGNVAFARSEEAEAEAARPGADPTARERAQAHAEDAVAAWRSAAMSAPDWPEACRNVERALLRLDRLRERRTDGGQPDRPSDPKPGPSPPGEPPPPPPDPGEEEAPPGPEAKELAPGDVLRLLERLKEKEREKVALREARRAAPAKGVERDW
jgi:hypothetical protein